MARWTLWDGDVQVDCDEKDWTKCKVHKNLTMTPPHNIADKLFSEFAEKANIAGPLEFSGQKAAALRAKTKEEIHDDNIVELDEYNSYVLRDSQEKLVPVHNCNFPWPKNNTFTCKECGKTYYRATFNTENTMLEAWAEAKDGKPLQSDNENDRITFDGDKEGLIPVHNCKFPSMAGKSNFTCKQCGRKYVSAKFKNGNFTRESWAEVKV